MKMTKMTALLLAAAMALTACGSTAASEAASVEATAAPEATAGPGRTCRRNGGYLPADRYRPAGPRSYH
ncbi:MAG: hypothetical protein ACLTZH_10350 [Subdoligranulum sp.]